MIDRFIKEKVNEILSKKELPELSKDIIETDSIAEVIEKLIILHIRNWILEDQIAIAKTDKEYAELKRKTDICNKIKRPKYVEAINVMIEKAILYNKSLIEDSVKVYKENE